MKVFRDLFIRGSTEQLGATVEAIERSLSDGWKRDYVSEQQVRDLPLLRREFIYCFACTKESRYPAATLILTENGPGILQVANVIPHTQHRLEYDQYNAIVEEFCERFVRPSASRMGVAVELTDTQVDLEHWLSHEAAEKLRLFSSAANKSTGSSHPSDSERWMDFLVAAHREQSRLDSSTLCRWLTGIEGFAPEIADNLAIKYQFGRDLLAFSTSRRLGA